MKLLKRVWIRSRLTRKSKEKKGKENMREEDQLTKTKLLTIMLATYIRESSPNSSSTAM